MTTHTDFLKLAKARRSSRGFLDIPVTDSQLSYILEAARVAPSAVNRQPWQFVVVRSDKAKEALRRCYNREWFATAPLYLVVCVDEEASWHRPEDGKPHCDVDGSIAAEHIVLAATDLGLGSCWVCRFDPAEVAAALSLAPSFRPLVLVPIGVAAPESTGPFVRKPLEEIVVWR